MAEVEKNVTNFPIKVGPIAASAKNAQKAEVWAEGTDAQVEELGGTHSAKGWAESIGNNYMPKSGGTFTGDITMANNKKVNFQHTSIAENNAGNTIIGDGNGNGLVISKNGTGAALFTSNGSSYTDLIKRIDVKSTYSSTGLDPVNGTAVASAISGKQDAFPSGTTGQYLQKTADGVQWSPVSGTLPTQTGQSGKFLTTDGTDASWATVSGGAPTLTWFTDNTGTTLNTGLDLSNANLVKVYKNGLLLQPSVNEIEEITFTSDAVSKYIKLNNALDLSKDFEINFTQNFTSKIGTWNFWLQGTTFNSTQNSIGEATDGSSIRFIVRDSNAYGVFLSSDGSSALVDSWGWGTPTLNKEYDCRLTYTKSSTTFNIKIKEHSSLDWAINTNVSTSITSLFPIGGYLRFYPSGEIKLSSIKVYSEGNPFFIGLQSSDYTNVGCIETTQMSPSNDYVIMSNSLVFTTALESTDKIAVEVF